MVPKTAASTPVTMATRVPTRTGMTRLPELLGAGTGAGGLAALAGVQDHLADADGFRGDFDAFVLAGELQRLLQREGPRRGEVLERIGRGGTHVGELLLLRDVYVHVIGARVLADDHALVDLGGRLNEEAPAFLEVDHRERRHHARTVSDHRTVGAVLDVAGPRLVAVGDGRRDAGSAGVGEEVRAEADQPAGGNGELHANPPGTVVGH